MMLNGNEQVWNFGQVAALSDMRQRNAKKNTALKGNLEPCEKVETKQHLGSDFKNSW